MVLPGCGLPAAWAGQAQWRILDTGFGTGTRFLQAWHCWKDDPQRPRLLHYVAVEPRPLAADQLRARADANTPQPLADALAGQWWGLLPGVQRLSFEGGRVLLTLCVGKPVDMLRQQSFEADVLLLEPTEADPQSLPLLKAAARLCRRGSRVAVFADTGLLRRELAQCGFVLEPGAGAGSLQGRYDPAWQAPPADAAPQATPGRCAVIGAGLAGAAAAASLARRGWQVQVFDAADRPAQGASALPAGLMAPHQSPDDNLLSRLSRSGVRATVAEAERLLGDTDWRLSGVLEHRLDDRRAPPALGCESQPWTREATSAESAAAGLAADATAWWHERAAWIRPAALVRAWLAQPGIEWRGGVRVARLASGPQGWSLLDDAERTLATADLVVVAAALGSAPLLQGRLDLHAVRGQVSWGAAAQAGAGGTPVNGNGHFIPCVPLADGPAWLSGSSYVRGDTSLEPRDAEQQANLDRLQVLVPGTAQRLAPFFAAGQVRAWTGVRCASTDRRPLVGEIAPGLWVSTAMGSRGLSFAALCGELLAARLHGEPLPLERRLADALDAARQREKMTPA